jgi:hypothetical protein
MKARLSILFVLVSLSAHLPLVAIGAASGAAQQPARGGLRGQVTDPSGATVAGATVLLSNAAGASLGATADKNGAYEFKDLAAGTYTVKGVAQGFALFSQDNVVIAAGQIAKLNIALTIEVQEQQVTVTDSTTTVSVDPANNAGMIVIKDKDLEALSDDPDEFQSELQALAGPSAGPNGGQIYIDGFTAGQLPPKSSIREIRINQNPFSAEYDKLGYGRIEILTKPGTDNWHGQVQVQGTSSAFNSRDPFLGDATQPGYDSTFYNASVGGPLSKTTSFFFSIDRRDNNNLNIVSATVLDPADPTETAPFSQAVPFPQTRTNLGPRVDFQLGPNNTLSVRYQYFRDNDQNEGVGGFNLASQAYNSLETEHTLQITDTQVLSPRVINETRFQYRHDVTAQNIVAAGLPFTVDNPTVNVQGAFISGPNSTGNQNDAQNSYELQNFTAITAGSHLIKFGGRLRVTQDNNADTNNFNGQFTFASLSIYQNTLALLNAGETPAMIYAAGFGPKQYSVVSGTPALSDTYVDIEPYVQDDWKFRPNITLSYGLRYEAQNGLGDHHDFAPRLGAAWGVGAKGKKAAIVVLRAGFGIFYDRFTQTLVEQQERLNGVLQMQSTITDPNCFPVANPAGLYGPATCLTAGGAVSSLGTVYQNNPNLRTPYTMQTGISVERQLTKSANLAVTYLNSRGVHQYVTTNINAPLPCTVAGCDQASQPRANPSAGDIYQYQDEGIFKQNQLIVNSSVRMGTKLSLFGYYTLNFAKADTAGPNTFASDPYDIPADYGPTPYDIRNRLFLGGTIGLPYAFRLSPFVIAQSGAPYNVTTGADNNGDSIFNDRPAFATGCGAGAPANLVETKLGCFNTAPLFGDTLVPYDYALSPGRFSFNLRVSKSFGFGAKKESAANAGMGGPSGGTFGRPGGGGGGGGRGGPGGGFGPGNPTNRRFGLTFSVSAQNLFNNVNVATPVGIVTSPIFGEANGLAGRPFSTTTANRRLDLQVLFSF